jgi:uncharacterized protein (TIGR02996 family)
MSEENTMQRTFELIEGSSRKFWSMELDGKKTIVTFGRIGTKGQRKEKKFRTEATAQKEYDRLIAEKLKKGYKETTPAETPAPAAPVLEGRAAELAQALEEALVENPDDLASHAAYADLLSENGDPRGELIQIQIALEDESLPKNDRAKLKRRERKLLKTHERQWLGELAPFLIDPPPEPTAEEEQPGSYTVGHGFSRGWLNTLHIHMLTRPFARALRDAPEGRLLRTLFLDDTWYYGEKDVKRGDRVPRKAHPYELYLLAASPYLGSIRCFRFGADQGDEYQKFNVTVFADLVTPIVKQMPRLEELYIYSKVWEYNDLFQLSLPNLRVLLLYHSSGVHRIQFLADNPSLANLTSLLLHPHHIEWWRKGKEDEKDGYREEDGFLPLSVVRPVLNSKNLPNLAHLRLRLSSMGDEGCEEIVRSGILKRLKTLDLRHGCITDIGAQTLADCPDVKNLEWLDLDRNALSRAGVRLIKRLGIPVRCNSQQTEAELNQDYGAQYLCEGEFE